MMSEMHLRDLAAALADELSPTELRAIVAEARAEAVAELRARLKEALVVELLERAARGSAEHAPAHQSAALPTPLPVQPTGAEGGAARQGPARPSAPAAAESDARAAIAAESDARAAIAAESDARAAIAAELAALRARLNANRTFLGDAPDDAAPAELVPAPAPPQTVVLDAGPQTVVRGGAPQTVVLDAEPWELEAPSNPQPSTPSLTYVYGVMLAGVALPEIAGLAPGTRLELVPCGDLCAIVSPVPPAEFSEAALEAQIRDPIWLERMVRAHEVAQRALLALSTLVPLRFATIYTSHARVAAMLREQAGELHAALGRLAERSEWGVKLWVNQQALAEGVSQASPALRDLQAQIAARPTGAAYMLQRRMERLAAEEAERLAQDCVAAGHARLCEHATAAVCGPLREGGPEQMLLNGSYLVDNRHQEAFLSELDRLAAEHASLGLRYELGGPWPGYHFCAQC